MKIVYTVVVSTVKTNILLIENFADENKAMYTVKCVYNVYIVCI